jgi:hypothetical protein
MYGFIFSFKLNAMGFISVYRKSTYSEQFLYTIKGVNHIVLKIL